MKRKFGLIGVALLLGYTSCISQNKITCLVRDSITHEGLPSVSVTAKGMQGLVTDSTGKVIIPAFTGLTKLLFSSVGYKPNSIIISLPLNSDTLIVEMEKAEKDIGEVIVSSSRTESRIEDLPTKVEVLGAEEVNEEVGIKPGNIASLLGDIAGIQTQQTSAATGNTEMRVQGLPGKYTQLLKDGVPLFGGYSGSFSILQIPPLDLKQIEIVKGASSTLYGGGAIAGMINLVSKRPKDGVFENTILLNQSSLKETNANFYSSGRKDKLGYTFFTGTNYQQKVDVNKDGFSDVPHVKSLFVHPNIFIYPNKSNLLSIGYNGVFEDRKGGDMLVLDQKADNQHQYFNQDKIFRNTIDAVWENKINTKDRFSMKATSSWLNRHIETNTFGMKANQLSYFSEATYLKRFQKNDLVTGINFTGEHFTKKMPDSTRIEDYDYSTIGLFAQDDWKISGKFIIQSGLRFDHHNQYGDFVLPRISMLYRMSHSFTTRLGGGLGYKIPTVFSSDIDERDYPLLLPLGNVKPEKSGGLNWDVNFHKHINSWDITINQTFYITRINHPLLQTADSSGDIYFSNADKPIRTGGFETYVQIQYDRLEIYLGYVYTIAKKMYDRVQPFLSLSARNKFASVLAYEFSPKFRAGIEAAFTGKQYLDDGRQTPAYPFVAAMMRYDLGKLSFVLNCENLLDYRQTKKENIISGPITNPVFAQLWAPIDGRAINLSMRIQF